MFFLVRSFIFVSFFFSRSLFSLFSRSGSCTLNVCSCFLAKRIVLLGMKRWPVFISVFFPHRFGMLLYAMYLIKINSELFSLLFFFFKSKQKKKVFFVHLFYQNDDDGEERKKNKGKISVYRYFIHNLFKFPSFCLPAWHVNFIIWNFRFTEFLIKTWPNHHKTISILRCLVLLHYAQHMGTWFE